MTIARFAWIEPSPVVTLEYVKGFLRRDPENVAEILLIGNDIDWYQRMKAKISHELRVFGKRVVFIRQKDK